MKEIAYTKLLVSVNHCYTKSANLEVYDTSCKGQARKIYSAEEVKGGRIIVKIHLLIILVTGYADVTYNPRRGFLGAIPVRGKIAYHLYGVDMEKTGTSVKLIRKSRWYSQLTSEGI